jgi:uncharacterized phage infection (PIP) family protein YhgE
MDKLNPKTKANEPVSTKLSDDLSVDPGTQKYREGFMDAKKSEIKQELSDELRAEIKKEAKKIEKEFQNNINQNQTRVIEALAVFVGIFSFISINIQIFSRVKDLMSASIFMIFMALMTMIIVSFPIFLLRVIRDDPVPKWVRWILIISIILLIAASLFSLRINIPLNQIKN